MCSQHLLILEKRKLTCYFNLFTTVMFWAHVFLQCLLGRNTDVTVILKTLEIKYAFSEKNCQIHFFLRNNVNQF